MGKLKAYRGFFVCVRGVFIPVGNPIRREFAISGPFCEQLRFQFGIMDFSVRCAAKHLPHSNITAIILVHKGPIRHYVKNNAW